MHLTINERDIFNSSMKMKKEGEKKTYNFVIKEQRFTSLMYYGTLTSNTYMYRSQLDLTVSHCNLHSTHRKELTRFT